MIRTGAMLLVGGLLLAGQAHAADDGLKAFGWKNRVLLVFSAPDNASALRQTRQILADPSALDERDMTVLMVSRDKVTALHGTARDTSARALRREVEIAPDTGFAVVLVGKDGSVKLRSNEPVSSAALFGLIDGMPMRAREARP